MNQSGYRLPPPPGCLHIRPFCAFTLIELLVVISILSVLMALLLPALGRSREIARRTRCASQVKMITLGAVIYSVDNKAKLMRSAMHPNGQGPFSNFMWKNRTGTADWSVEAINPYIQAFHTTGSGTNQNWFGVIICPDTPRNVAENLKTAFLNNTGWLTVAHTPYAYYGRMDVWSNRSYKAGVAGYLDELTTTEPAPSRLLVSDAIYRWAFGGTFAYNHGLYGASFTHNSYGAVPLIDAGPRPMLAGANRGMGDGSVRWKDAKEFNVDSMDMLPAAYPGPVISSQYGPDSYYY